MVLDKLRDIGAEELGDFLLKIIFKKYFMKDTRAIIMSFGIIPSNHEIMTIRTVSNCLLVHDSEVFTILEDFFASFMGVDAYNIHTTRRALQIILLNDLVVLQDSLDCLRGVEWKQCI